MSGQFDIYAGVTVFFIVIKCICDYDVYECLLCNIE